MASVIRTVVELISLLLLLFCSLLGAYFLDIFNFEKKVTFFSRLLYGSDA